MTKIITSMNFIKLTVLVNFMCRLDWLRDAQLAEALFLGVSKGVS